MTIAIGMTNGVNPELTVSRPSTADKTDTAGVIIASPRKSAVAAMPSMTRLVPHRPPPVERWISASSARLPPSPLLSARRISATYLIVTMTTNDQNIRQTVPKIWSLSTASGWWPTNTSFIA